MVLTYKENYIENVQNILDEFDTATICIPGFSCNRRRCMVMMAIALLCLSIGRSVFTAIHIAPVLCSHTRDVFMNKRSIDHSFNQPYVHFLPLLSMHLLLQRLSHLTRVRGLFIFTDGITNY